MQAVPGEASPEASVVVVVVVDVVDATSAVAFLAGWEKECGTQSIEDCGAEGEQSGTDGEKEVRLDL